MDEVKTKTWQVVRPTENGYCDVFYRGDWRYTFRMFCEDLAEGEYKDRLQEVLATGMFDLSNAMHENMLPAGEMPKSEE